MIHTIFYIDASIEKEFAGRTPTTKEELFFQELAISYQHGYCYLCGDKASLNYLCNYQTGVTRNIYNVIRSHYAESGAAMKAVQYVFVLTYRLDPDPASLPNILKDEDKCRFINIQQVIDNSWRLNMECCLLTENLEDSKFYQFMARHYCRKHKIPQHVVHFHSENGGGNTICDVLEKCVTQDKVPVLCIVDSDRKHGSTKAYPNEPAMGDTYNRAQRVSNKLFSNNIFPPHCLFALHVCEVENLIPLQLLNKMEREQHLGMQSGLDRVNQILQTTDGTPLLYYDYKNGFPYMKDIPQRSYWEEILTELGGEEESMPSEVKPESGTYDPKALFFPPLNNKILHHALKKLQEMEQQGGSGIEDLQVNGYLEEIWANTGKLLLTWGYTCSPLRA